MLKKIVTIAALFFCCICFADGFNQEALKNPPANIQFIDYKDGDVCYIPKAVIYTETSNIGTLSMYPRIIRLSGVLKIQILFISDKGHAKKIYIKHKGNFVELKIAGVRESPHKRLGKIYWVICELPIEKYVEYFIKNFPPDLRFNVPQIDKSTLEVEIPKDWKDSFDAMKPFFKLDNEVQIRFQ